MGLDHRMHSLMRFSVKWTMYSDNPISCQMDSISEAAVVQRYERKLK